MPSTLANIGYNSIAKIVTMTVAVATSAILARNLGASDYGIVGIAMMVIGFLGRFSDMGMTAALVQRSSVEKRVLETAQALNFILAVVLFACALVAAPFTVIIFKNHAVPQVVGVLACTLVISAIGFLPSALLTREMRFAALRTPFVTGAVVRGIVSVACALTGWKYWSLVIGSLAGTITTALLLRMVRNVEVKWRVDRRIARELLHFGLPLSLAGLLVFLVFNIDNFVIGSLMGATQLGFYTVALTWATFGCGTVYETVHSVLFPRFSQAQHSRAELAAMYYRSLRAVMFATVMANAVLFAVADGFLVTVLGKGDPRWLPALFPLQILCIYGAIRASVEPVGNVIMALGRSKLLLRAVLVPIVIELSLVPLAAIKWGLPAVAWLVCGAYTLQWAVYGPFLKRELGIGPVRLLRAAIPVSIAAVSAVLVARTIRPPDSLSWSALTLRSGAACVTFILVHEVATRGAMLSEVKRIVNFRLNGPFGTSAGGAMPVAAATSDSLKP
jgi:O-antigen/teichoic acid export membrane protein